MAYTLYSTSRSASALAGALDLFSQMTASFISWGQARKTRAALVKLSDRELEDIGLTRGDIERVATQQRF